MNRLARTGGLALLAGLAFLVGYTGEYQLPSLSISWPEPPTPRRVERVADLVMAYVGSSTCTPSNADSLPIALARLRERLSTQADSAGLGFITIGIARDFDVEAGLRHLKWTGNYDEVNAGNGWSSLGTSRYLYRDFPGQAATPEVVVTIRENSQVGDRRDRRIYTERFLARALGSGEILRLAANGVKASSAP